MQKDVEKLSWTTGEKKNKPWIMDIMDKIEKRQLKGQGEVQYITETSEIHSERNKRKEQWLNEQCEEVKKLCRTN